MNRNDPKRAAQILATTLAVENPAGDDVEEQAMLSVKEAALKLAQAGVNVSSLDEGQWRSRLLALGLNTTQVARAMEELAQWGITDDQ